MWTFLVIKKCAYVQKYFVNPRWNCYKILLRWTTISCNTLPSCGVIFYLQFISKVCIPNIHVYPKCTDSLSICFSNICKHSKYIFHIYIYRSYISKYYSYINNTYQRYCSWCWSNGQFYNYFLNILVWYFQYV